MDLYSRVAYKSSALLTRAYSTSFSVSSRLFPKEMRHHIYAIYGLVRLADEIVDTYRGKDALELLNTLEEATYAAIDRGYDINPIVHAFAKTAQRYTINKELIRPFFESMRIDLDPHTYNESLYQQYIHGSAEVVGLMCLKVFCDGSDTIYQKLSTGAAALGSAYQKVNFLRDIADDYTRLGRMYFPGVTFESFSETAKTNIINDIRQDFMAAQAALTELPKASRIATMTSYAYYQALFKKLQTTPLRELKKQRVRINNFYKIVLLCKVAITESWKKP